MFSIERKVARTAKRAGLLSGGLLLCSVGAAFLTVAAWFALLPTVGIEVTALIIAGAYLGLGLISIGMCVSSAHEATEPAQTAPATGNTNSPPIVQAFMYGLQAGAKAEQTRH